MTVRRMRYCNSCLRVDSMRKLLKRSLAVASLALAGLAQAEVPADYKVILLTENFPPYNMAINGKNFAQEDNIDGIAVDIIREMFKRAGIEYSMTLRFPWSASTSWPWKSRAMECSSPPACRSARSSSNGSARLVRMTGCCLAVPTATFV